MCLVAHLFILYYPLRRIYGFQEGDNSARSNDGQQLYYRPTHTYQLATA